MSDLKYRDASLIHRLIYAVLLWFLPEIGVAQPVAQFVGGQACAGCHEAQFKDWLPSDHAKAMQPATAATVLGDFNDATLTHHGVTTTFSRRGDQFMVRTDGPGGTMQDFPIAYTFGVAPLQQYLIAFPGGRLQALGIAWDSRPAAAGGQRWYHLYPDATPPPGNRLHWTGRDQTWNHMCAGCHSTGLVKNHDAATDNYTTSWTDVNVSCEACHGPGSTHVAWARTPSRDPREAGHKGLSVWLKPAETAAWEMNPTTGMARRTGPMPSEAELNACVGCHARRRQIATDPSPAISFLDRFLPALLTPDLYHADGQIDGEVFEWGSFVQSPMHRAGVTCTNCHEPHGAKLRAEGNAVCAQCHLPARFDTAAHHRHADGPGAQCTACHMPTKVYMGVDVRHDHGFRVPRPDLSVAIGTPNACTQCHADRDPAWAARSVAGWYPNGRQSRPHFATALHAGRTDAADARRRLENLILDTTQPPIARATALPMLQRFASASSLQAQRVGLSDPDPLVRMAAIRALPANPSPSLLEMAHPLLTDPVRAVRIEAARFLADANRRGMNPEQNAALESAISELIAAELVDADRPETHLNLGLLATRRGQLAAAEAQYRTALQLDPLFVPAMVNLADVLRQKGNEPDSTALLRQAIATEPDNADAAHGLALALIRHRNYAEALDLLRRSVELAPGNARYAYVYAIALHSRGDVDGAIVLLRRTHDSHPADRDVLSALVTWSLTRGDAAGALSYARALAAVSPDDRGLFDLIRKLERR
jgi:predicted CXXCH cytochrome family protein